MKREEGFFDRKDVKGAIKKVFYAALVVLVALDFVIDKHAFFTWEGIAGFSAIYGFLSCVVIVAVSKILGKIWLQRGEDYYDD